MPRRFTKIADKIYNFTLRKDDIWIVTYPKTGTTWTQEMVWMLVNDVNKEAANVPQMVRSPFIEASCVMSIEFLKSQDIQIDDANLYKALADTIEYANTMTGRRVLKTHLTLDFLPPKLTETCKVIYVARNPKDTAVSFYKHNLVVPGHGLVGSFNDFVQFFEEGLHVFGSYWQHVLGGWKLRDHRNVKFLWFEHMKKDQKSVIEELCTFLNHPLSADQINYLVSHVAFENMSKNPMANPMSGL